MTIREVATARLREYENNPRNNDLAVEKVKYSIERFGFLFPVIIDMNYVIVAGHTRVRACRELGIQSVPCIIADELTEEQINLFRLVDNKSGEYSDWDFEKLKEELSLVDLTLEKNQLLLDRFELSAEVFDIEPEQAEIKIPTLNFMGSERKREEKKPTVQTVASDDEAQFDQIGGNDQIESSDEQIEPAAETPADPHWKAAYMADEYGVPTAPAQDTAEAPISSTRAVTAGDNAEAPAANTKRSAAPTLIQFRFGDVAFFISQPELDIGIIAAMYVELRGLQKLMTNTAQEVVGGITFTVGKLHGCEVVAAVSGVGKVAAAACAQAMILRYRPDAVINTGVAGTLSADLDLLDIAIAESVCQHDMDTSALGDPIGMVSGFNQVYFDADLQLCRDLARCAAENGIHSKTGVIASGDQFLHTTGRKMWIRRHFGAIAAEMEGAAIGQVCTMSGVPFAVIRAISDGDGAAVDYTTFSEKAAEVSACVVSKLLSELA